MKYHVKYAAFCMQGLVRTNNEDNLWCDGKNLQIVHTDDACSGELEVEKPIRFGVFDGLGGEYAGEVASHLASDVFGGYVCTGADLQVDAMDVCEEMNRAIVNYMRKNAITAMGTTAAALVFRPEETVGFNSGDSRCYRLTGEVLEQISVDHTCSDPVRPYKKSLTGCLGNPEGTCEPAVFTRTPVDGDLYILCSDGVTNTICDRRMKEILLRKGEPLEEKARAIREVILRKGAEDNATLILMKIESSSKEKTGFFETGPHMQKGVLRSKWKGLFR